MKIHIFKKGDIITRIAPSKSLGPISNIFGPPIDRGGDRSYMGEKLTFVGIANGQIYFENHSNLYKVLGINKLSHVSIDIWDEGWDYWVDPNILYTNELNPSEEIKSQLKNKEEIEDEIKKAIKLEDYFLAAKLRDQLKNIK